LANFNREILNKKVPKSTLKPPTGVKIDPF